MHQVLFGGWRSRVVRLALGAACCLPVACGASDPARYPAAGGSLNGGAGAQNGGSANGGSASGGSANGGSANGGAAVTSGTGGGAGSSVGSDSLAAKYADYFPIGAAVSAWHLDHESDILARDFTHLTAENAMKVQDIHPSPTAYAWAEADRIANFARAHGMKMTGHNLLWHRQAPAWMFQGVVAGDAASLALLKGRLKAHIEAVVDRYADVVDNWDVVNEVISDDPTKTYRDGSEMSKWYELFGSEDYIYWAYQYAHDALEAKEAGSSQGKLYYNEYVVTVKADKILKMFAWLKGKGIQLDGIGFQSHETMTWPTPGDLQAAFDKFIAAGYKIKISELDVTVYQDYASGSFVASPAVAFTPALDTSQAARFAQLFAVYRKNHAAITSVTFWGVSDDHTWLDNEPVPNRNDYPLLYNDQHQPKAARAAIMDF